MSLGSRAPVQVELRAASVGNRAPPYGREASEGVLPLRAPTTTAGSTRDPRRSGAEAIKTVGM
jgi:hypothetical protein